MRGREKAYSIVMQITIKLRSICLDPPFPRGRRKKYMCIECTKERKARAALNLIPIFFLLHAQDGQGQSFKLYILYLFRRRI